MTEMTLAEGKADPLAGIDSKARNRHVNVFFCI
jgi:hypothetical protein